MGALPPRPEDLRQAELPADDLEGGASPLLDEEDELPRAASDARPDIRPYKASES